MTDYEFDNYRFSTKTEVKCDGEWHKVTEVLFQSREFWFDGCIRYVGIDKIEAIRQSPEPHPVGSHDRQGDWL